MWFELSRKMDKILFRTVKCTYNFFIYNMKNLHVHRNYSSTNLWTISEWNSVCFKDQRSYLMKYHSTNSFHFCSSNMVTYRLDKHYRGEFRKQIKAGKEEGAEGETASSVDIAIRGFGKLFPDEETPNKLFNGVKFCDLPIVHVKVSRNNTIISVSDAKGMTKLTRSCGMDGFKNTKKGTNVAAQVTAQTVGLKTLEKGMKYVRVTVSGLGPGRMASVKGLTLGGLNVVSISDVTPISFKIQPRPRKARRI